MRQRLGLAQFEWDTPAAGIEADDAEWQPPAARIEIEDLEWDQPVMDVGAWLKRAPLLPAPEPAPPPGDVLPAIDGDVVFDGKWRLVESEAAV
jgi:hypothetical protein